MSGTDIAKAYDPSQVERRWYQAWLAAGAFDGTADPARPERAFCIVIPPPNVTGMLTMGHVLNNTIQDILTRHARQDGKAALWLPGTDHAGLSTQSRVEKDLRKEGLDRRKMGREKFLQRVVEWRDKHGGIIIEQLQRLGCSCDWRRTVHTLDPAYSRAVFTAFVELFQRGHIYRGRRMVNWCPASLTALSDEEVIPKPQKGSLYHMRYEIVERPGEYINIATTRPETLMGDTAVAVHPDDPRYQHLHGAHVWRPFPRAQIPIIFDRVVDKDFGSGALKVTPAHDKVDFDIGQRHQLPILEVIAADGRLNALAGEDFAGVDRFKARQLAAEKLQSLGLLVKEEPYENTVGFSERADVPIEPRLSDQWFLRYPRIEEAKAAVREGHIRFIPEHWNKVYLNWLDNIQDWCISRQVWWGHRIPVWYHKGLDRAKLTEADYADPAKVHVSVKGPPDALNWEQDEDSLDTWASSWLWPFATLGWPNPDAKQADELNFWYPTNDLVTGPDIIFFWVARMIIAGLEFMRPGEPLDRRIPFKNVYFHGIIRDKQGRKMSKSLGNSPDPIDLIDKYGADALRFGTMNSAALGNDILFDETNVELGRNFCNKLWNAVRFRRMSGPIENNASLEDIVERIDPAAMNDADHAILSRLADTLNVLAKSFSSYEFNTATQSLYDFFKGDFCDFYLEAVKSRMSDPRLARHVLAVQDVCLRQFLLMLHPFMPFITEELWHVLAFVQDDSFIDHHGPDDGVTLRTLLAQKGRPIDDLAGTRIDILREFISQARALKAQAGLAARRDLKFSLAADLKGQTWNDEKTELFLSLAGAKSLELISVDSPAPVEAMAAVTAFGTLYLDLAGAVDKDAEKTRLSKELALLEKHISGQEAKLANEAFTSKAPASVIEGARKQLAENQAKRVELERLIKAFGHLDTFGHT